MTSMASGGGPMKVTPRVGDGPGEVGVLGEEAVAGVDGVGAAARDRVEDGLGVEVALGRGLAAEGVGLVGEADVQGVAVEVGVHGDGGDAELAARADDPDGDLAPVGDQDPGRTAAWRHMVTHRSGTFVAIGETSTPPTGWRLDLARAGAPEGVVVVADHQTAGRGRLGARGRRRPARRC